MPTAAPVKKFAQVMGDGSATNIAVTHYLGTKARDCKHNGVTPI